MCVCTLTFISLGQLFLVNCGKKFRHYPILLLLHKQNLNVQTLSKVKMTHALINASYFNLKCAHRNQPQRNQTSLHGEAKNINTNLKSNRTNDLIQTQLGLVSAPPFARWSNCSLMDGCEKTILKPC